MKGIIYLNPKDVIDDFLPGEISFDRELNDEYDYSINIFMDLNDSFTDLISKHKELEENIDMSILVSEDMKNKEDAEFYKKCKSKSIELLNNTEYVSFDFDIPTISKYIESNPELKSKKIVFDEVNDLDPQLVLDIKKYLPDCIDNIYIKLNENNSFITLKEYEDTILTIARIVEDVKRYNLSPLEQIMYVYDIVKERIYTKENKDESYTVSRDLTSALLGDKIVCAGYARILGKILDNLGIQSNRINLFEKDKPNSGHTRNEIYVKDKKYGIEGVYYFDATWDSKKNESDTEYLQKYRFFALTKNDMDYLERRTSGVYTYNDMPCYSTHLAKDFETIVNEKGIYDIPEDMRITINHMSTVITGNSIIPKINKRFLIMMPPSIRKEIEVNQEDVLKEVNRITKLYDNRIPTDKLMEVLFNVRKVEYYNNPIKYPLDADDIVETAYKSLWQPELSPLDRFLLMGASRENIKAIVLNKLNTYKEDGNYELRIKRVVLTKLLNTIKEEKESQKLTYSK